MAKGIPLMGRGPDGKAKMINVDENGNVKVQQSGTIKSTKVYNSPGSLISAGVTETLLEITGEVILHDVIFYFRENAGDTCMRVSFFNGSSWSQYTRFSSNYGEWHTIIKPNNVHKDPLFKTLGDDNLVTLRTPGLRTRGVRIERRNLSAQEDGNIGVTVIYSEV